MRNAVLVILVVGGFMLNLARAESPATVQDAERGFNSIFNGKDLKGWDGDARFWSVNDGVLIGRSTAENPCKRNTFLIWGGGTVANFELRLSFRITSGNSGIQFRSRNLGEWRVNGMQADMEAGPSWTGGLYEEGGRGVLTRRGQRVRIDTDDNKTTEKIGDSEALLAKAPVGKWNSYTVIARGGHITLKVNNIVMSELHDNPDMKIPTGIIALQLHAGPPMKVEYKDIRLRQLSRLKKPDEAKSDKPIPNWIWLGPQAKAGQELYFRRVFDLPLAVSEARLVATCDNHMQVYVNEQAVLSGSDWQRPLHARVETELAPGRNVIAIWARNDGGPAGLLVELKWKTESGGGALVTDEHWRVSSEREDRWTAAEFDDSGWGRATGRGRLDERLVWQGIHRAALDSAPQGSAVTAATPADKIATLPGFKAELLYSVPRWQGSWVSLTTDDKGRLLASDQYGGLYRITPGKVGDAAAKTQVEQLDLDIGEAQGLLFAFDSLYVVATGGARESGLYRVRDTDGDDRLDTVELLKPLNGGGEHGPHAIVLSPDRKSLYIIAGNHVKLPDFVNASRVPRVWGEDQLLQRRWDPGGHAVNVMAPGGWICRIDPDAKEWELIAIGFRNSYDIAFSRDGELFTYDADMEWDVGLPWYRPTRICHVVSGAEFGWRSGTAKWPEFYPDSVPPVVNIGLGSPTGVAFGYGAKFPERYRNALYAQDWTFGMIYAVHLEPSGSGYSATFERFVSGKPLPVTDMVIGHDGAMYFTVGGRRMQSGLYRITHAGPDSGSGSPPAEIDGSRHAADRAVRRRLESFHGRKDARAINFAWPHLGSRDRLIRYAARVAIEHQDVALWQSRALAESGATASINALLALVRCGGASLQPAILARLDRLPLATMTESQVLEALRVYGLAFIRMGRPVEAITGRVRARLEPMFPSRGAAISRELCRLLVYLNSPKAVPEAVRLIETSPTQEDRIYYAFTIRQSRTGWTPTLRQNYFEWINSVLASYSGGASFRKYIDGIKQDALATLTEPELATLDEIINAPLPTSPAGAITPRRYVHNWQMEDLLPLLDQVGKNRSFERGKLAYRDSTCLQCHRFAGAGGNTGHDLTSASGRLSPRDLLESIIQPSRVISDQYQDMRFVTRSNGVILGQIESENDTSLTVRTHPLAEETIQLRRDDIESMGPSKTSRMPTELLSILEKDEVLDLLAYILSGGDPKDAAFRREE